MPASLQAHLTLLFDRHTAARRSCLCEAESRREEARTRGFAEPDFRPAVPFVEAVQEVTPGFWRGHHPVARDDGPLGQQMPKAGHDRRGPADADASDI